MEQNKFEHATFAGGCFWCVESCFLALKGVITVESGYSGGILDNPTYQDVCTGKTGHAEVVYITYDPNIINYETLVTAFLELHNPTELNKQGVDVGTQYRSAVFYHNDKQKEIAQQMLQESENRKDWNGKYVTTFEPFTKFWRAEEYHQDYYNKNPMRLSCDISVNKKITKFKSKMKDYLK